MYARYGSSSITPGVKNLILSTIAVFLIQQFIAGREFLEIFGLVPLYIVDRLYVWQVFTYIFLHGDLMHIAMNMFFLWMFGCELEREWGTKEFVKYYLLTGTIAGITIFLWNFNSFGFTIGASGAVFAILAAYALFYPDREIMLLLFPVPIKVKYFVLIIGLLEFIMLPRQDGISHIGHLGGLVAGFLYLRHRYARYGIGNNIFKDLFKKKGPF
ncbi:MAG: rhomboid family intramembrane serine protease [Calditrichia bacterium]|nr:rhomboid family intramembrane serine protease [Calditrichota bacterium]MCB0267520.1 rhomboid family intramembrane serine protease [Calditrichota bacterium]